MHFQSLRLAQARPLLRRRRAGTPEPKHLPSIKQGLLLNQGHIEE